MLNVLLSDKYLTYAVSIGIGAGLFYLYSIGYNHWLYNPLLYRVWTYADLTAGDNQLLLSRVYCLVVVVVFLTVAHVFFQRRLRSGNK